MQRINRLSPAHRPDLIYIRARCEYWKVLRHYSHHHVPAALNHGRISDSTLQLSQISRRKFSQTCRPTFPEAITSTPLTQDETPQYKWTMLPKVVKPSRESQIRQSLRNWGARNQEIKREEAADDLPHEGRVTAIPNSLFLGPGHKVVEREDADNGIIFDNQIDNQSLYRSGHMLRPGTLIHFSSTIGRRQDAIYLGELGLQSLLLLSDGSWIADKMTQKRFAISRNRRYPIANFLTPSEVEAVRHHMPVRDVTRSIGEGADPQAVSIVGTLPEAAFAPVVTKIRNLHEAERRFLKSHKAQLEPMYENLAYEDRWRTIHIKALTPLVLGVAFDAMTDVAKKAFVDFASSFHPLFITLQTADTITYCMAPKSLNEALTSVQEWSRLYQEAAAQAALGKNVSNLLRSNPLSGFIDKARRIIVRSRKIRSPTSVGTIGPATMDRSEPSRKSSTGESWTPDEKKIIDYMYDISMRRPESSLPRAHTSLILRAIGAYPNMVLDDRVTRMLLQELGCIDPWTMVEDLNTPLSGRKTAGELDQLWDESQRAVASVTNSETALTEFPDNMAHIRSDWGEMEAFCIDSSNSQNREDALSVEPADELEGGHWIHVHIVHASAHLDKDHPVMRAARKRGTSHYSLVVGESIQQLFPKELIQQFSLGRGVSTPVLTISTLLTSDGQVHDVKVSPSTVRNIKRLDRDTITKAMGASRDVEDAVLAVGRIPHTLLDPMAKQENEQQHLEYASSFLPKLMLIKELLNARRRQRAREVKTPARFKRTSIGSRTSVILPENDASDRTSHCYHWKGDPAIIVRSNRVVCQSETFDEHRADDIVAQAMRLSSESLGKWLADRQIPSLFLGNDTPSFSIQELNENSISKEISMPLFTRTAFPRPLFAHNMKQYSGCTSPLRRFSDMLVHLQTDSYLKAEAQGLVQKGMPVEQDEVLAFTKRELETFLEADVYASDALDDFDREKQGFWLAQALFRAFHFKEAAIPEVFEVLVQTPARRNAQGQIDSACGTLIPWGGDVFIEPSPERYEEAARYHEFLPVRIVSVEPGVRQIIARAVGPPSSKQQMTEPLRCLSPGGSPTT